MYSNLFSVPLVDRKPKEKCMRLYFPPKRHKHCMPGHLCSSGSMSLSINSSFCILCFWHDAQSWVSKWTWDWNRFGRVLYVWGNAVRPLPAFYQQSVVSFKSLAWRRQAFKDCCWQKNSQLLPRHGWGNCCYGTNSDSSCFRLHWDTAFPQGVVASFLESFTLALLT